MDVQNAIRAGANVNSQGPPYLFYDPASPLIDRKLFLFKQKIMYWYIAYYYDIEVIYGRQNNIEIANLLIDSGANLNYQNGYGYTALILG